MSTPIDDRIEPGSRTIDRGFSPPRGLPPFFTEVWRGFSYYGMRASSRLHDETAGLKAVSDLTKVASLNLCEYLSLFCTALIGGWLAIRFREPAVPFLICGS